MCSHSREEKKALRAELLGLRNAVSREDRDCWNRMLKEAFLELPEVKAADTVYVYLSYGSEIDTHGLTDALLKAGKKVAAPRVDGQEMAFYEIGGMEDTAAGYKGIPEPASHCRKLCDPRALVLMPGLAFTKEGDRMGYGGGFYDRFLSKEPGHIAIALAYPFQLLETIPVESADRRIQGVVLPDHIIWC
jgi:5-formyltetrahydrofolate cyclo-ligase